MTEGPSAPPALRRVITRIHQSATVQALRSAWTGLRLGRPENRRRLETELGAQERLGNTADGKHIYRVRFRDDCALRREVGRLRELSFRRVGEGTGRAYDLDAYDDYYEHLILWDAPRRQLVGAYRVARARDVVERHGLAGLYTSSLFEFGASFEPFLREGLELGRSFIQPRYWGSRSLDSLWYGIGAYLLRHPEIRYLFGPVSISAQLPEAARDLLVCFFRKHFGAAPGQVRARRPFALTAAERRRLEALFRGPAYADDYRVLKRELARLDTAVPVLYKQYAELCEPEGVRFFDFSVDPEFGHCLDGFIMLDLAHLKARKRDRYLTPQPDQAAA